MSDKIIRALAMDAQVMVLACSSKNTVQTAANHHNTTDVATAALGRSLSAAAMMGIIMKNDNDKLTLSIKGDGALGEIVVTAGNDAKVKGYVSNPDVVLPVKNGKLDVASAVGKGRLRVIRDTGMKEPYVGEVELQNSEIAQDMAYYFAMSEQIPSAVGLGVLVTGENTVEAAGGFIVQMLPFASDEAIDTVEAAVNNISRVTDILKGNDDPEKLIKALFGDSYEIKEEKTPEFFCDCNRDKLDKVMISLGEKELESIISDDKPVDVQCSFCKKIYTYEIEEVQRLLKEATA